MLGDRWNRKSSLKAQLGPSVPVLNEFIWIMEISVLSAQRVLKMPEFEESEYYGKNLNTMRIID
jgi:hypothetical protein